MYLAYLDQHHDQLNNHIFLYNQMQQQMLMDIHHNKHELKYFKYFSFLITEKENTFFYILSGFAFFRLINFCDFSFR